MNNKDKGLLHQILERDDSDIFTTDLNKMGMREATPEEQKAIQKGVENISKPTGFNLWDLLIDDTIED